MSEKYNNTVIEFTTEITNINQKFMEEVACLNKNITKLNETILEN